MKKIVLLFALLGVISLNVNAQSCPYSAKAKGEKVAASAVTVDAALAAETNVQKRVCAKSGSVSYVRKDVCQKSGKVSYADVEFCSKSGKFVNVSPSGNAEVMSAKTVSGGATTAKKGCCAGKKAASCSSKAAGAGASNGVKVKTVSGSTTAKKACCAGKKASSCSKSAKASSTEMAPAKTKLVKAEK